MMADPLCPVVKIQSLRREAEQKKAGVMPSRLSLPLLPRFPRETKNKAKGIGAMSPRWPATLCIARFLLCFQMIWWHSVKVSGWARFDGMSVFEFS